MRVCAHMNLGPHSHHYFEAPTIAWAVENFRHEAERFYGTLDRSIAEIRGEDMPCVDLYPACPASDVSEGLHCSDTENFHGHPFARWEIGPRGGIRKVMSL